MSSDAAAGAEPRRALAELPAPALTLVTVVFETELPLLTLQAVSLARYVPADVFAEILVIDNSHRGMSARRRSRLLAAYGDRRGLVRILRPGDIGGLPTARGWVTQQVLKLLVTDVVTTPFYLVLDAKNHWVRPTDTSSFVNPDGRARGACHSYRTHALADTLTRVLDYMGVAPEGWLDDFPVTHTPVILETEMVRRMIADVESRGKPFADAFVDADLTEFFLYAAWLIATYGTLEHHLDGSVVRSATVWPGQATAESFERTLRDARSLDAPFVSIHRTALARAGRSACVHLIDFWVERGLLPSRRRGLAFVAAYKVHYFATMAARKARTARTARTARATR